MYNPNREPAHTIDPFMLLAEYRLDLLAQGNRARMRKAAREGADDPPFSVFANVTYAGLIEGTLRGPRPAAWPKALPAEEQALPARRQSAGSFRALLRRMIGGTTRTATGIPGIAD